MSTERAQYTCVVCDEPVEAQMSADCNWCNGRYHLNQRNDIEAKDCGEVWIDEQYMALQFACAKCLRGAEETPSAERAPTKLREMSAPPARARTQVRRRYKRRD